MLFPKAGNGHRKFTLALRSDDEVMTTGRRGGSYTSVIARDN